MASGDNFSDLCIMEPRSGTEICPLEQCGEHIEDRWETPLKGLRSFIAMFLGKLYGFYRESPHL